MTCENNKKGCNNKILIHTWMLASMVCMLSVSDMFGMRTHPKRIDPDEAMEKINKNEEALKAFYAIFEGRKKLIKKNCCCCGGINIKRTKLPTIEEDNKESSCALGFYIKYRFTLNNEGKAEVDKNWEQNMGTCEAFDDIIKGIYGASSK